ncbi:MAG: hypothetical protein PHD15_07175, partial [Clostridia bacterium]|nr:hypothetical protein [Clostridia bacterium]
MYCDKGRKDSCSNRATEYCCDECKYSNSIEKKHNKCCCLCHKIQPIYYPSIPGPQGPQGPVGP